MIISVQNVEDVGVHAPLQGPVLDAHAAVSEVFNIPSDVKVEPVIKKRNTVDKKATLPSQVGYH